MISKLGKYIPLIFLIFCVFIFIDSLISFEELQNIRSDQRWVTHTYQTIHGANKITNLLLLLETNVEDYLLTNNHIYLSYYNTNWGAIKRSTSTLEQLTSDTSTERTRAINLKSYIYQRKNIFDKTLSLNQADGIQRAQSFISTGEARTSIQKIRTLTALINNTEVTLLSQREGQFTSSLYFMYATIFGSALLNILLLLFTYIVVTREFSRRTELEKKKNEFISLASHELKTPITTLSIYTEMLLKEISLKTGKGANSTVMKMRNEVTEMKNLINDLLDVTRIQLKKFELQKETFNLSQLIRQTTEEIQLLTKKHRIIFRGDKNLLIVADRQRIWQVITNLLNNAVKYSPKGGRVFVSVSRKKTRAVISVKDEGIGISKKNLQHIFDRYFREGDNENQIAGLGLGLYLSREIIDLHHGHIRVKSVQGKGTTFLCTLPLPRRKQ